MYARGQKSDIEEGKRVGADTYLVKPFSPLELIDSVKKALS
jgi:DNA-binding response OmpR family regulator